MSRSQRSRRAAAVPTTAAQTLERIASRLGIVRVLSLPAGEEREPLRPSIHDPSEELRAAPGDVVLGVGVSPRGPAAIAFVRSAGAGGAAAVVLKIPADPDPELVESAAHAGVALLAIPPEVTWGQAHALLQSELGIAGPAEEGTAPIGDLFALANAVAAMVGGPVTIEDPQSRVLAYSSLDEPLDEPRMATILGRRVPDRWMRTLDELGIFERLRTGDVVRFDAEGLAPRLAVEVRVGGRAVGSIWVAEGKVALGAEAEAALREAARIAALHLIHHRSASDLERARRADLVRALVDGEQAAGSAARRLGLEPDARAAVVAFEPVLEEDAHAAMIRGKTADLTAVWCEAYRKQAACAALDDAVYVVLAAEEDDALRAFASEIVDRAHRSMNVRLRAGIGGIVTGAREIVRSRREADRVLDVTADGPPRRAVASIEDVRGAAVVAELAEVARDRPHLLEGKIAALVRYDAEHGSDYVATLTAYLDRFGDVPAAATVVGVHANTFRYRLRRLLDISRLDLDDPDERLGAQLQLRFLR